MAKGATTFEGTEKHFFVQCSVADPSFITEQLNLMLNEPFDFP